MATHAFFPFGLFVLFVAFALLSALAHNKARMEEWLALAAVSFVFAAVMGITLVDVLAVAAAGFIVWLVCTNTTHDSRNGAHCKH